MAGGRDPPVCWCPPRCGAPLRPPPRCCVLCVPLWWARAPCAAPPLRWVLAPCAGAPPQWCDPDRDHCYDRREATVLDASIRSRSMETPGEWPPTRLRVVCQEGWDGARRHPQPAAGIQSAEQWCSSQLQQQPQLRYQQAVCFVRVNLSLFYFHVKPQPSPSASGGVSCWSPVLGAGCSGSSPPPRRGFLTTIMRLARSRPAHSPTHDER